MFNSKQAAQDILKTRKIQYSVANFKELAKKVAKPYVTMSSDNISEIFSAPTEYFPKAKFRLL